MIIAEKESIRARAAAAMQGLGTNSSKNEPGTLSTKLGLCLAFN